MYSAEIIDSLRNLPFAPSAQMQPVPYDIEDDSGDSDSDLDVRISGTCRLSLSPSFHSYLPNPLPLDALKSAFDKLTDLQIPHKKTSRHPTNPLYPTLTAASKLDKTISLPSRRHGSKRVENDWNEQQR